MKLWAFRIIAVILIALAGIAVWFALSSTRDNASGWAEVAIAFIGLPILVYELVNLRKKVEQAQWEPDIHVGVAQHPLSISDIESALSTEIELIRKAANFHFSLVIQNRGKRAARFVKIHLVFESFEDKTYIPVVRFSEDNFEKKGTKDYVFSGGRDWIVYPTDAEWFHIELDSHPGGQIRSGDYLFQCTVRTEGLDTPVREELKVKITDG